MTTITIAQWVMIIKNLVLQFVIIESEVCTMCNTEPTDAAMEPAASATDAIEEEDAASETKGETPDDGF